MRRFCCCVDWMMEAWAHAAGTGGEPERLKCSLELYHRYFWVTMATLLIPHFQSYFFVASSLAVLCSENCKCFSTGAFPHSAPTQSLLQSPGIRIQTANTSQNQQHQVITYNCNLCAVKLGKLGVEIKGKSPFQMLSFFLNNSHVVQNTARADAELLCIALGT